ncbi:hypothetical protein [Streptomyces sp. C10-9-1]|uniref:hypothetical protein n=1 Tax=Streptomyces sp. C10-9-1 TaxID=1859285 RepID=UPI003D7288D8
MSAFGLGATAAASIDYGAGEAGADAATGPLSQAANRLLLFIPADIVAGYVLVIGFMSTPTVDYSGFWVAAWVFLALAPFVVVTTYIAKYRTDRGGEWPGVGQYPWYRVIAAVVAFAAWVFALPSSPAQDLGSYPDWLRPLVLAGVTVILTGLDGVFTSKPN